MCRRLAICCVTNWLHLHKIYSLGLNENKWFLNASCWKSIIIMWVIKWKKNKRLWWRQKYEGATRWLFQFIKGGLEFVGRPQKPLRPTLSPEWFTTGEMFVATVASEQHCCDAEGLAPLATLPCQVQSPALLCYKTAECPWRTELAANKK